MKKDLCKNGLKYGTKCPAYGKACRKCNGYKQYCKNMYKRLQKNLIQWKEEEIQNQKMTYLQK